MTWRITEAQISRVRELARSSCCNCLDGNCLLLDDGEPQTCVQLICTRAIYCRYFQTAVLPADRALYRKIADQNANGHETHRSYILGPTTKRMEESK